METLVIVELIATIKGILENVEPGFLVGLITLALELEARATALLDTETAGSAAGVLAGTDEIRLFESVVEPAGVGGVDLPDSAGLTGDSRFVEDVGLIGCEDSIGIENMLCLRLDDVTPRVICGRLFEEAGEVICWGV